MPVRLAVLLRVFLTWSLATGALMAPLPHLLRVAHAALWSGGDDDDDDDGSAGDDDDSGHKKGDDSGDDAAGGGGGGDDDDDDDDTVTLDKDQPSVTAGGLYTLSSYPKSVTLRPL